MNVLEQAAALNRSGKGREAVALVEAAARIGDAEAMFVVANWKLYGMYGSRDHALAGRLLSEAAKSGHAEAARLEAYLIANGTFGPSDPARGLQLLQSILGDPLSAEQLDLLKEMPAATTATALRQKVLSPDPHVFTVSGALTEKECRYLRSQAEPALQPSFIVDPISGARRPHPIRTSHGTNFGPAQEDLVINQINRRLAAITGTKVECGEPLHILRYSSGQEYKPHLDSLPDTANQRTWTVLVYLNDDYQGGATVFPELEIAFRGNVGDALAFANLTPEGAPHPRTRHAGLPVASGFKWLATRWIRRTPYNAWEK